eukprot:scaffold671858_cov59-Prasinocladus_malaysianus.AAC.1
MISHRVVLHVAKELLVLIWVEIGALLAKVEIAVDLWNHALHAFHVAAAHPVVPTCICRHASSHRQSQERYMQTKHTPRHLNAATNGKQCMDNDGTSAADGNLISFFSNAAG